MLCSNKNLGPYDNLNKNEINDKPNKCILLRFQDQNQNNKTARSLMKWLIYFVIINAIYGERKRAI